MLYPEEVESAPEYQYRQHVQGGPKDFQERTAIVAEMQRSGEFEQPQVEGSIRAISAMRPVRMSTSTGVIIRERSLDLRRVHTTSWIGLPKRCVG